VGLDVYQETIAVAEPGRDQPIFRGEIASQPKSVEKPLSKLSKLSETYSGACCCRTNTSMPRRRRGNGWLS